VCDFRLPHDGDFERQQGGPPNQAILTLMLAVLLAGEPLDKWILLLVIVVFGVTHRGC
jgi:hypothetical protein